MAEVGDTRPPLLDPEECEGQPAVTHVATVERPHSFNNELSYFIRVGMPLTVSALLSWGLPSLSSMAFAGHTKSSAFLQAAVGYGRVWYNCTLLMVGFSMCQYFQTMLPTCIGAKRPDRIGEYLRRGLLYSILFMLPVYVFQVFTSAVLQCVGIPANISDEVGKFSRIMIVTNLINLYNQHMITLLMNTGFARITTIISLIGGGLQVLSTYTFVYHLEWEMVGQGTAAVCAEFGNALTVTVVALACGALRPQSRADGVVVNPEEDKQEPLFSRREVRSFVNVMVPSLLTNFAGWAIFEFQMVFLANIRNINSDELAAGAAWVTLEAFLAATQTGFIQCLQMRVVTLLGKQDPGARSAYMQISVMSAAVVGISNVFLMILRTSLCRMLSNDDSVQEKLEVLFWVLIIHTQTRIFSVGSSTLLIPVGYGKFQTVLTFASFYVVAAPVAAFVALTDIINTPIITKMLACVALTSIAQILQCLAFYVALYRMDWEKAAVTVNARVRSETQGGCVSECRSRASSHAGLSAAS